MDTFIIRFQLDRVMRGPVGSIGNPEEIKIVDSGHVHVTLDDLTSEKKMETLFHNIWRKMTGQPYDRDAIRR